jgi:Tfp pilus assembly protein PilN
MADRSRFELLPDWGRWFRTRLHDERLRSILGMFFLALLAFVAIVAVIVIVQEWQKGELGVWCSS